MPESSEKLIFGRYTREECGLPSERELRPPRRAIFARGLVLVAAMLAAGWLGGLAVARWRAAWVGGLPVAINQVGADEASALLDKGRTLATAVGDRPHSSRGLAVAAAMVAEPRPRRLGYYGNLGNLFRYIEEEPGGGEDDFVTFFIASGVHSELGDFRRAFACLERAEKALSGLPEDRQRSLRLLLVNAQAYYLATAPANQGRNPEKALHLAQLMVSSRDELSPGVRPSSSAAFLDTLATAWHAAGDPGQALSTQTFALGLAEGEGLDVYLRHYDEFAASARR